MSRRKLAPLCLVLSCGAVFAAGGPSSGPVAIKTPASQEVFKTLWNAEIPSFVEFKGEPVVFALKAQDQYLVTLPYSAQADASKLPRTSSDAFESRLAWIAATTQMLAAVVKLPAGQWPTDGKAPVILAESTLAIDRDCALKGMPGSGSEDGPMPRSLEELFVPAATESTRILHFFRLETGWSEFYSGGGGSFAVQHMLEWSSDDRYRKEIYWRACAPANYSQMIAGGWNPDGTRGHNDYEGKWTWRFTRKAKPYPALLLQLFDADKKGKPVASWKTGWQDESPYRVDYYNLKAPD